MGSQGFGGKSVDLERVMHSAMPATAGTGPAASSRWLDPLI